MKIDEFSEWLDYHAAGFTGLKPWLRKMPADDRDGVRDRWQKVLAYVDIDDARAASDEMFESADQPRSFDKHPSAIRAIAAKRSSTRTSGDDRPRYIDGEEVFRCLDCKDTGSRTIWHRKTVKVVRAGKAIARGFYYTAACACLCEAGKKWKWLKPFDELHDVPVDLLTDVPPREQIEAVPVKAAYPEFDNSNNSDGW